MVDSGPCCWRYVCCELCVLGDTSYAFSSMPHAVGVSGGYVLFVQRLTVAGFPGSAPPRVASEPTSGMLCTPVPLVYCPVLNSTRPRRHLGGTPERQLSQVSTPLPVPFLSPLSPRSPPVLGTPQPLSPRSLPFVCTLPPLSPQSLPLAATPLSSVLTLRGHTATPVSLLIPRWRWHALTALS